MRENKVAVFGSGALIGTLGGLIGLGGAEFRLPLLISAAPTSIILPARLQRQYVARAVRFTSKFYPEV